MDHLSNLQLYEIFKDSKKNQFAKEPDFDRVKEVVSTKLDVQPSEQLLMDIKSEFKTYKDEQKKKQSVLSLRRENEEIPCLFRKNYVKRSKRPLDKVSDRQQSRRLSDFTVSTAARALDENVSPTKLYAYGLKTKYLDNKKIAEVGKNIFTTKDTSSNHVPLETASAIFDAGRMTKRVTLMCDFY